MLMGNKKKKRPQYDGNILFIYNIYLQLVVQLPRNKNKSAFNFVPVFRHCLLKKKKKMPFVMSQRALQVCDNPPRPHNQVLAPPSDTQHHHQNANRASGISTAFFSEEGCKQRANMGCFFSRLLLHRKKCREVRLLISLKRHS